LRFDHLTILLRHLPTHITAAADRLAAVGAILLPAAPAFFACALLLLALCLEPPRRIRHARCTLPRVTYLPLLHLAVSLRHTHLRHLYHLNFSALPACAPAPAYSPSAACLYRFYALRVLLPHAYLFSGLRTAYLSWFCLPAPGLPRRRWRTRCLRAPRHAVCLLRRGTAATWFTCTRARTTDFSASCVRTFCGLPRVHATAGPYTHRYRDWIACPRVAVLVAATPASPRHTSHRALRLPTNAQNCHGLMANLWRAVLPDSARWVFAFGFIFFFLPPRMLYSCTGFNACIWSRLLYLRLWIFCICTVTYNMHGFYQHGFWRTCACRLAY